MHADSAVPPSTARWCTAHRPLLKQRPQASGSCAGSRRGGMRHDGMAARGMAARGMAA
jgi:hypothetical protein